MVNTSFTDWQQHRPDPDPAFDTCSPNLQTIFAYLASRWGFTLLGCRVVRPIRGAGASGPPSSHTFGAAIDASYGTGRAQALAEVLPWLIDNSDALHVQAIHDYIGSRIWRAGRTPNVSDATTAWWKTQPAGNGMGESWATYLHIETTPAGWADATPIAVRLVPPDPIVVPDPDPIVTPDPPTPTPISPEDVMLAIYQPTFDSPDYNPAWFAVFASGAVRRATNADVELAKRLKLDTIPLDSIDQYDDLLHISGSVYPPRT